MEKKKAGFVALVGRPSVGKSTLVNSLCGEKVAIVSKVPQTTRNAIRGIVNSGDGQIVFVDTPGRHLSDKKLNKRLIEVSTRSTEDADLVLYLLDATRNPGPEEAAVAAYLGPFAAKLVVAINKLDAEHSNAEPSRKFIADSFPALPAERVFCISAMKSEGLDKLLAKLFQLMPEGAALYPPEYYTDQDIRFRIAEIIREKAINRLYEELPHAIYVEVADVELKDDGKGGEKLWARAFIVTERESQKGMVVGKGGEMVKKIRLAALKDLNRVFDWQVELDLRVKTSRDWRHKDAILRSVVKG